MTVLLDGDFGARARRRLFDEEVIWLVTVAPSGTPQPNPVWFLFDPDSDSLLIYNLNAARRLANLQAHPQAAAHFDADAGGGDVVVLSGVLAVDAEVPAPADNPAYLAKYAAGLERLGTTADGFGRDYSVALRFTITGVRGF